MAPVFYSPGNHEYDVPGVYESVYKIFLEKTGVTILNNQCEEIVIHDQMIQFNGLHCSSSLKYDEMFYKKGLDILNKRMDGRCFNLLLAHMPDYFRLYIKYEYDLVLSGHAHGGHIRIPFTNIGCISPGPQKTVFPEYVYGKYSDGSCSMIVSAGLGSGSILQKIIPRVGNPYEVVEITLTPPL